MIKKTVYDMVKDYAYNTKGFSREQIAGLMRGRMEIPKQYASGSGAWSKPHVERTVEYANE